MSTLFTINFRRESYLKELARARGRIIALAVWVAYFGALGVMLGLYGLNCTSLTRKASLLERQASRVRQNGTRDEWKVPADEMITVERYVNNPIRLRNRLVRLAQIVPTSARLTSVAVNPDNMSGPAEENKMVIQGDYKIAQGQDRMHGVAEMVTALRGDSLFATGFTSIRLVNTRISENSGTVAEFTIECR